MICRKRKWYYLPGWVDVRGDFLWYDNLKCLSLNLLYSKNAAEVMAKNFSCSDDVWCGAIEVPFDVAYELVGEDLYDLG